MIPFAHILVLAFFIFTVGLFGVLYRPNVLLILMSLELMLNSVNLVFVAAAVSLNNFDGQIMMFFIATVAACEAAVGLAMVIALFRRYGTIRNDFFRVLRG